MGTRPPNDRDLIRLHWPVELRPAFDALFAIDDALADIAAGARDPALAAIKFAWWREQLIALDSNPPPAEPRLQAVAAELLPRGISGADLSRLEEPWALLLHNDRQDVFMKGVAERGLRLFKLAAQLLGISMTDQLEHSAQSFAAADLGRRGILDLVPLTLGRSRVRAPPKARPLSLLEALARRDMRRGGPPFEPEGTPARAWALLRHRMTGRF